MINKFLLDARKVTAIACVILINFSVILSTWYPLKFSGISATPTFLDLRLVLKSADCYKDYGVKVFSPVSTDPCSGYIYGSKLLSTINFFHIGRVPPIVLGLLFIFLISTILIFFIAVGKGKFQFFKVAITTSPPVWLLTERGNLDAFIVLLVFTSALLISRNKLMASLCLMLLSALFKFYTLPLLPIIVVMIKTWFVRILASVLVAIAGSVVLLDIRKISFFGENNFISFGLKVLLDWIQISASRFFPTYQIEMGENLFHVLMLMHVIAISIVSALLFRKFEMSRFMIKDNSGSFHFWAFIFFTTIFVSCYYLGTSYDYRLVFLVVAMCAYENLTSIPRLIKFLTITSLWFSCMLWGANNFLSTGIQIFGDLALAPLAIFLTSLLLLIFGFNLVDWLSRRRELLNRQN